MIIKGKITSFAGIATKSAKSGENGEIATMGKYYLNDDVDQPYILFAKNAINSFMANYIYPILINNVPSDSLSKDLAFNVVKVELFNDEAKNTISFGKSAQIVASVKYKSKSINADKKIYDNDIAELYSLRAKKKDPNSAIMIFVSIHGQWYGMYDFTYNRKIAFEKYKTSKSFINSALSNYGNSQFTPLYDDVYAAFELLAETTSLILPKSIIKAHHKDIQKSFKSFCTLNKLQYYEDYEIISQIRDASRYGRKSPHDMEKNALKHLSSLLSFSTFMEKYLGYKVITPEKSDNLNIDELKT